MNTLHKVLVVEDDPDIGRIIFLSLETIGKLAVKVCTSGEQALEEAADFAPDMIVLDVMMPGMDGMETLAALRETTTLTSTPVVFLTAKVHSTEIDRYQQLGVAGVIPKPFDPMTLKSRLMELFNTHQT